MSFYTSDEGDHVKLASLKPYQEPPRPERQACVACRTYAPECLVPMGDEALPMCWLCAHHVVEHDTAVEHAYCAECECTPQQIFPHRAFESAGEIVARVEPVSPREADRTKLMRSPPAKIAAFAREAHKQMSDAQIAAVKKRIAS
jgi:hypothetical protein